MKASIDQDFNRDWADAIEEEKQQAVLAGLSDRLSAVEEATKQLDIGQTSTSKEVNAIDKALSDLNQSVAELGESTTATNNKAQQATNSIQQHLTELHRLIYALEVDSYDGTLLWNVDDLATRVIEAEKGEIKYITSKSFFTGRPGYQMRGRLYLNGDGKGAGTHISLFLSICKGPYDDFMPWPFSLPVTLRLIHMFGGSHCSETFKPCAISGSFKKPVDKSNPASGSPRFALKSVLSSNSGFVVENSINIQITIDLRGVNLKVDLPPR